MVVAKPRKVAGQTCKSAADASEALQAGRQAGRQAAEQAEAGSRETSRWPGQTCSHTKSIQELEQEIARLP